MGRFRAAAIILALALFFFPAFADNTYIHPEDSAAYDKKEKEKRDKFYGDIEKKVKLNKSEIKDIRERGYGPACSFVMLMIAKETKQPVKKLIKMRDKQGMMWGDLCRHYGVDYPKFIRKLEDVVRDNNLVFPVPSYSEGSAEAGPGADVAGDGK